MKKFLLYLIALFLITTGCKDEHEKELSKFLNEIHVEVPNLEGNWQWAGSSRLLPDGDTIRETTASGGTLLVISNKTEIISPVTEGYEKAIVFENDRKYKEYIDRELVFETYYRAVKVKSDPLIYKLFYFEQKESQKLFFEETLVQGSNGAQDYIAIEDDCRDCFSSHSYRKNF